MPTPPTLSISINGLVALLQQRLADTGVYWSAAELSLYVRQAIREFQVLTGYWRSRISLSTVANQPFYDLSTVDAQLSYTVDDLAMLQQVCYQLLEYSGSGTNFIRTTQFTLTAITDALDQRREDILGNTRLVLEEFTPAVAGGGDGIVVLPSGVIQLHRLDFKDSVTGKWVLPEETDEIGAYGWVPGWPTTPGTVQGYSVAVTRPFQVQLIPPPLNNGSLDLLLTSCNPYTYTGSSQPLNLPDDCTYALPWGIHASVLGQDAQSRDYQRADYSAARFAAAVDVLKTYPLVMQCRAPNGLQIEPSTMNGLDSWQRGWRNIAPAQPQNIAVAGRNLVAFAPVPNAIYAHALDCIVNSPASGSASATISVPGDIITALLNNAQHTAAFKMAGDEWMSTMSMYREFTMVAQQYSARERADAINFEALRNVTKFENQNRPYELQGVTA